MIVICAARPKYEPCCGVFCGITGDGKADRTRLHLGIGGCGWEDGCPTWRWPREFICGSLYYRYADGVATIEEWHPWVVACRPDWPRTYLDLLPADMRRAVLVPMCRQVLLSRRLLHSDRTVGSEGHLVFRMGCGISCSLMEAIDRVTTGCQAGCRCRSQHGNTRKAIALATPQNFASRQLVPSSRMSAREWRNRHRK